MQQVLFHLPFTQGWFGMPDGIPLPGFGAMLFLCFVLTAMLWGPIRAARIGMPKERLQDMAIVLFLAGIAGARVFYMVQYSKEYEGKNLFLAFFEIWNGGIVFYGGAIGAVLGFAVFHRLVLRKLNVSMMKLADAVAPLIAVGLAVGRIGCYLNGCCWGQVACEECQPVPISAELGQFPLLPAHARDQVVRPAATTDRLPHIRGLQTSTGFSLRKFDPRPVVEGVEPGSEAEAAGLKPGDVITQVNGEPAGEDTLGELVRNWPRGRKELVLVVDRDGKEQPPIAFTPKTVTFFPTQLYETISMVLLIGVLLTFQPLRTRDGQVMVALMVGYAVHRFFNEAIRIEPAYALGLTASQWISVFILLAAFGLWLYIRTTQPRLPPGLSAPEAQPLPATGK
jgi:phosphatidylglycerol:prolipoprotein diacylglycerol transferase